MNYIKGQITIFNDLAYLASRGKCFYGAIDMEVGPDGYPILPPALEIFPQLYSKDVPMSESVSCIITSVVIDRGGIYREDGKHCIFIYPVTCGKLAAIYVQEDGTYAPTSILGGWDYATGWYQGDGEEEAKEYYIYYQVLPTKDENLGYQFVFASDNEE